MPMQPKFLSFLRKIRFTLNIKWVISISIQHKLKGIMMKFFYLTWVMIAVFIAGFCAGYFYYDHEQPKLAIVDVTRVVANSSQVQNLKAQQDMQNAEMAQWLQNVKQAITAEKNKSKQDQLTQQYSAEFESKRNLYAQQYVTTVQNLEQNINNIIANVSRKKGYKYVINKGMILSGGDDITDDIIKEVK